MLCLRAEQKAALEEEQNTVQMFYSEIEITAGSWFHLISQ